MFVSRLYAGAWQSNTATIQPSPSPSASPSPTRAETASVQVTLPLLDALLTDEKFVGQLKSKLKVTDDQVAELKRVSSDAVLACAKATPKI